MGYELVAIGIANDYRALGNFISFNHPLNQTFTPDGQTNNNLFEYLPPYLKDQIQFHEASFFNHKYGVTMDTYNNNQLLFNFFRVLTVSWDDLG